MTKTWGPCQKHGTISKAWDHVKGMVLMQNSLYCLPAHGNGIESSELI